MNGGDRMGIIDTVTKDYMRDNRIFADAFNGVTYHGVQRINPDDLHTYDSTEITMYETEDEVKKFLQLFRDELKLYTVKCDEQAVYMLLGIENQSHVHYAMPVKNMLYDAVDYDSQVRKKASEYEAERKQRKKALESGSKEETKETVYVPNSGEFLTGFCKKDRLVPIVNLVVYFGKEEWDGPRTLHEMFPDVPKELLAMIPDYKINLIVPTELTDEEIDNFHTGFREILLFLKYAKDKMKLKEKIRKDPRFQAVDTKTVDVIDCVAGTNFRSAKGDVETNMCEAIDEMVEDGRREGHAEGREEGLEALVHSLKPYKKDLDSLLIAIRENAAYANVTAEQVEKYYLN